MIRLHLQLVLAVGLFIGSLCFAPVWAGNPVAGQVTLVIGQADILRDGQRLAIKRGSEIFSGDEIETQATGHIYIHFVDDALVTVRPQSRLQVQTYDYDEAHPENSTIRFNLQEGVVRSVSGKGAKAARQRYRLNTPIAAIGVRGTDFIVKAGSQLTRAFVNEGAIVVAPFSDACQMTGLGPCSAGGMELKGGSNQVLELDKLSKQPRLLQMELEDALGARMFKAQDEQVLVQKQKQATNGDSVDGASKEAPSDDLNKTPEVPDSSGLNTNDHIDLPDPVSPQQGNNGNGGKHPGKDNAPDDDQEEQALMASAMQLFAYQIEQESASDSSGNDSGNSASTSGSSSTGGSSMDLSPVTTIDPNKLPNKDDTSAAPSLGEISGISSSLLVIEDGNMVLDLSANSTEGLSPADASSSPLKPDDLLLQPQLGLDGQKHLPVPADRQLVWGYYGNTNESIADFAIPYQQQEGYVIKVRGGDYLLMRQQSSTEVMTAGLGTVDFALNRASATLTGSDGTSQGLDVNAGALRIDFNKGTFKTALQMGNSEVGNIGFSLDGQVTSGGLMSASGGSSSLGGAVSLDGQEAAYIFNHLIQQGQISGLTLWGAK